jgi:hypothetical protein
MDGEGLYSKDSRFGLTDFSNDTSFALVLMFENGLYCVEICVYLRGGFTGARHLIHPSAKLKVREILCGKLYFDVSLSI